jgi:hypothetical protein
VNVCASEMGRLPARPPVQLRQSAANLLQLPVLFAVVLLAIVIRQLFVHPPSTTDRRVAASLHRCPGQGLRYQR